MPQDLDADVCTLSELKAQRAELDTGIAAVEARIRLANAGRRITKARVLATFVPPCNDLRAADVCDRLGVPPNRDNMKKVRYALRHLADDKVLFVSGRRGEYSLVDPAP